MTVAIRVECRVVVSNDQCIVVSTTPYFALRFIVQSQLILMCESYKDWCMGLWTLDMGIDFSKQQIVHSLTCCKRFRLFLIPFSQQRVGPRGRGMGVLGLPRQPRSNDHY